MMVAVPTVRAVEHLDSIQEIVRPVTSAYTFEAGSSHLVDTYLSPIRYSGWHTALGYERWQAMKQNPEQLVMRLKGNLNLGRTRNPVGNATMWSTALDLQWTMMRRWSVAKNLTLGAGAGPALSLGCIYASRNGNNPISAKGALTIDLSGYAAWNHSIAGIPVTFSYNVNFPVIGAFFSPDYGELYYEIYLGDTSGLIHCAWPGNRFDFDNRFIADIHLGATSLRLGYHLDIFGSSVNHITTRQIVHSAIIGISGQWLSLDPRRRLSEKTRIISALF